MSKNKSKINNNLKIAGCSLVSAGVISLSLLITPKIVLAKDTGCTFTDIVSYTIFEHELNEIKKESHITFQNTELYNHLKEQANGKLTTDYLQNITTLIIEEPLSNNDLSDLKYLPNLTRLEICGMNINCQDIIYNQKLRLFNAIDCHITNLNELPNTIEKLYLQGITTPDNIIYVPYHTNTLELNDSTFNKIHFKNPESLISFNFEGYALLDLNDLINCTNLKSISLTRCPNIANSANLNKLPSLKNINLDDYSCIWLNSTTLNTLNIDEETKEKYLSYIQELDQIASSITANSQTKEEILNNIIIYVTNKIDYDIKVANQLDDYKVRVNNYNEKPIYYALNKDTGICVNYACLFTALANRTNIDNYQPASIVHTWNMVRLNGNTEYGAYDMSGLDSEEIRNLLLQNFTNPLKFYNFDIENIDSEDFETTIKPIIISNIEKNIGYLKDNGLKSLQAQLFVISIELIIFYITLSRIVHKQEKQDTKIFKYKRKENN